MLIFRTCSVEVCELLDSFGMMTAFCSLVIFKSALLSHDIGISKGLLKKSSFLISFEVHVVHSMHGSDVVALCGQQFFSPSPVLLLILTSPDVDACWCMTVLSGTKYGLKQTRGKFGLGAKMVREYFTFTSKHAYILFSS